MTALLIIVVLLGTCAMPLALTIAIALGEMDHIGPTPFSDEYVPFWDRLGD